jgi:uncharacterized MAPEG superfamily protein
MNFPVWSLFAGILIPYICATVAAIYKKKQFGKVDFHLPREQSAKLEGVGYRANAAQQNAWEALAVYSAAFMAAFIAGLDPEKVHTCAIIWVIARALHAIFYITNIPLGRVIAFVGGMFASFRLIILAMSN